MAEVTTRMGAPMDGMLGGADLEQLREDFSASPNRGAPQDQGESGSADRRSRRVRRRRAHVGGRIMVN
jgi:hypothetical protein